MESKEVRRISIEEWLEEGEKLFGEDKKQWRFRCPNCKGVQTSQDFRDLGIHGLDPAAVYVNCIGRHDPSIKQVGTLGDGHSPCDYTSGGLFNLAKTMVVQNGKEFPVFEFAEATEGEE